MNVTRLFLPLILIGQFTAFAIEPWADDKLPVKDGLALWLDAGAELRALSTDGGKVKTTVPGLWHDASGNKRDAHQEIAAAQPGYSGTYLAMGFSFDGKGRYFAVKSEGLSLPEATVVVFARARSNAGGFRGLISASATGKNDYVSGFNIDLGGRGSEDDLGAVNVEGAGFSGEKNLLQERVLPGAKFALISKMGAEEVQAAISAAPGPTRPRAKGRPMQADQFLIGARSYDNTGAAPTARGFFDGDIFEVLVYARVLSGEEMTAIRNYLTVKYAGVVYVAAAKPSKAEGATTFTAVKDPPLIQPLVPGFTVRKLPVSLPNINFLRYREDGRLYAGGYDGKIYVLRDTDGDGLEDKADVYYDGEDVKVVMGMALTPPGYPLGEGVFVATRGHILLILDTKHTGKGDKVITVAKDWEPPRVMGGGVSDALAVAVGKDGSIYFNLGTSSFTNPYLLNAATGKADYRTTNERGTIQRVAPDFSKRETVCTGVRFTVGLAFNPLGDLFATDQEGATWLANGNPFDELLHIQTGRHYGFPPRHPEFLPEVVDEPSTFDYGPQHQSTVGLCFDEPVNAGGPSFGPAWWRGDALVSAMSRGKIYRTKLVKTDVGYVAKNETIARLQRIIIDQAVSPSGALTVTLHSGSPDWGTGPTGNGELWQIVPAKTLPPQPVNAWSASPTELRVSFDAPLNAQALSAMQGNVRVVQSRYAQAGDRFETMRPGYQVVKNQLAAPRFLVGIQRLALADDGRTLVITTAERTAAANYAISIEGDVFQTNTGASYAGQIDLLADLTGLEAEFQPTKGNVLKTWLPHPDFAVSRIFTEAGGGAQREFFARLNEEGSIALHGQLDLGRMLQPAIQEGSKLDWEYPNEQVTVTLEAARPFSFTLGKDTAASQPKGNRYAASLTATTTDGTWLAFNVALANGAGDPALTAQWFTDRSATPRPFPLRRILLPYAQPQELPPMPHNEDLPELAGGNWENGKVLFKSICTRCHMMRGEGGRVGPDLSNLIFRDYDSVLRDIREPSATINPEHVAYTVMKKDGSAIVAVLLAENANTVSLGQATGEVIEVPRADIVSMKQLPVSLMPEGLEKAFTPEQMRDLMSYLLLPPFGPAPLMIGGAPPPRKMSEVRAILGDALTAKPDPKAKPLRIVLCASEKDKAHNKPGYHDYPLWRSRWSRLLGMAEGITVEQATDWPSAEQWARADIIAFNTYNPAWSGTNDAARIAALGEQVDQFLARGGGLVFLHWSLNGGANADALAARIGAAWKNPAAKFRHGASDWALDRNHPLAAGFGASWQNPDESYWNLAGDLSTGKANILATSVEDGAPTPQMWTREVGAGRVFVSIPGHFTWTYDDPLYRILILRGMMWTAKQPLDRLAPLSVVGARVEN